MQIVLEISDDTIAQASSLSDADWLREIAIALFQQDLITLGRGSKMAGMHRIEFQKLLASRGICVHYDVEEFEADIQLDERLGRREALKLGLPVIGILGFLVTAKQRGLIAMVQTVMDALIEQAGFRVSPELYDRVLVLSNEKF